MTSRFTELVIDAHDLKKLADFWCSVLDYKFLYERPDIIEIGPKDFSAGSESELAGEWKARARNGPPAPTIVFVPVPEGKEVKNRVHIDVSPLGDQQKEVERVLALGATLADIGQGDEVSWIVLRDPEENEFCILRSLQS
jgi:Glyoxalase-like domain